jgi:hypothetical protein
MLVTEFGLIKEFFMKERTRFLGIIALIAVIGFSMAACTNPTNSETEPPGLTGTVSISGELFVGEILAANTGALGGTGTVY